MFDQANFSKSQSPPIKRLPFLPNGHEGAQESLECFCPNDSFAIKGLIERSHVNSAVFAFGQRGLRQVGGMMPTKSITTASLWTLIMVAAKQRRRERVDRTPTGPPPALRWALWGAFTYKGAMGLNPDDHAEGRGICAGSRQPFCVDGHLDPRQVTDIGVMNADLPATLLAFDEDDEVFVNSFWMAFSNKGWPVNRGDCVDVVVGNFRAKRLVVHKACGT
jgi:hypothetical protein